MIKIGPVSKSTHYRRLKRANELGCQVRDLPDLRGKGVHANGQCHPRWNAGKILSEHGYVKVRVGRDHPLADPNGYAYEHLVVWVSSGNQTPSTGQVLHHRNGDKTDNRIGNLELHTQSEHVRLHNEDRFRDLTNGRFIDRKAAGRFLDGREWSQFPKVEVSHGS